MPNIVKYCHAVMNVSCLDWWRFRQDSDGMLLEQYQCKQLLADVLVRDETPGQHLEGTNALVNRLNKMWNLHQGKVIPSYLSKVVLDIL